MVFRPLGFGVPGTIGHSIGDVIFGGGGGGDGAQSPHYVANYLRSLGFNLPEGMSGTGFTKMSLIGDLLKRLNAPTGLENFYGPEFENRATQTALAQGNAPFAEAGRSLASNYLRSGAGSSGAFGGARTELARTQSQTVGQSLIQMLMGLEGARAGNVQDIEGIRVNRQSLLLQLLQTLMGGRQAKSQLSQERSLAREENVTNVLRSLISGGASVASAGVAS